MSVKLPYSQLTKCPELKENPFRKRICKIFSADGLGNLSFTELMLLFSSMCEHTPRDIKLHYAFTIYDFDGDKFIGVADIEQVIQWSIERPLYFIYFWFRPWNCWPRANSARRSPNRCGGRCWRRRISTTTRSWAVTSSLMSSTSRRTSSQHSTLEFNFSDWN